MSILQKVNSKANIRKTSSADLPYQPQYPVFIESYTEALKPAANTVPYKIIYASDLNQIQISNGSSWNPSAVRTYTTATLPAAGATNLYQIAFITDTLQVKISDGTQWKTIGARLDTYTSGTIPAAASNANSIIWVSDLQQVQISNGTAWVQVGSKAGTKNYFSQNNANPDFETNSISPWSACSVTFLSGTPSGAPTLISSPSPTQMSIATTATTPLSGTYSMLLTKPANNTQYQGFCSAALTIDREDTAKVLYGSFYYEVTSGATNVDFSGSSTQSLEIWIYNTVSGQWTQPAGYRGMNQSSGVGRVVFSFQTDGTFANNAYRVVVFTQQISALAYSVKFDDFVVGPQAIVLGTAMTDWQSYTPIITAATTNPTLPTSGINKNIAIWRRVGDSIEIHYEFITGTVSGGANGSGDYRFSLPPGLSIDDSKIPSGNTLSIPVGSGRVNNNDAWGGVYTGTTLTNFHVTYEAGGTAATVLGNTASMMTTSNYTVVADIKVPIAGWGSFSQMSSDTDTRMVGASFRKDGTIQSIATATVTKVTYQTVDYDTHGGWNAANNRYYVPVSGLYYVSAIQQYSSAVTDNRIYLYKNGVFDRYLDLRGSITTAAGSGSGLIQCSANDYLEIFTIQGSGGSVNLNGSSTSNCFQVFRLSGPSVITATETVAASYETTGGPINTSATLITFGTKILDTHNAYSSGVYTIPVSGTYEIYAKVHTTAITLSNIQSLNCLIYVDGADTKQNVTVGTGGNAAYGSQNSHMQFFRAGQTVSIYASCSVGTTVSTVVQRNSFFIKRVGS